MYTYFVDLGYQFSWVSTRVDFLCHMVMLFTFMKKWQSFFLKWLYCFIFPPAVSQNSMFSTSLSLVILFIFSLQQCVLVRLIIVLIYMFLVLNSAEFLFKCLLTIYISSFVRYPLKSFCSFLCCPIIVRCYCGSTYVLCYIHIL